MNIPFLYKSIKFNCNCRGNFQILIYHTISLSSICWSERSACTALLCCRRNVVSTINGVFFSVFLLRYGNFSSRWGYRRVPNFPWGFNSHNKKLGPLLPPWGVNFVCLELLEIARTLIGKCFKISWNLPHLGCQEEVLLEHHLLQAETHVIMNQIAHIEYRNRRLLYCEVLLKQSCGGNTGTANLWNNVRHLSQKS